MAENSFGEDLVEQRFQALEKWQKIIADEINQELEIIQKTVANLISGYTELVTMTESIITTVLFDADPEKLKLFETTLEEKRKQMLTLLKNELQITDEDLDE